MMGTELKICCHAQWTEELTTTQSLNYAYNFFIEIIFSQISHILHICSIQSVERANMMLDNHKS